ncbi:MAG: hypothetical protein OH319_02485 [Candidatus Parvarchaeota archaeon]|nr:hypothetical protein [Candidatus Jingweiarchaeum tengchongense]MCW1298235.1 hypothetical protein [Candidatus Jingweiarchaeum tengchongense]MCW1300033.1 hypothetical protein [Candidatus Jingweiarchaeum tengchongense]MCW1304828.1 hypothetical protein [Candidatus Jingweiarchaeum tengchongense]MCW1305418.1 hypothetical protein [Candidatus Jingweiarchaeum tengchongense]
MKGQFDIVREILVFAAGIFIVVSTAYLFNRIIVPKIRDYTINNELMNVESHVSFLIKQSCALASYESMESSVAFILEMPQQIVNYPYMVYVINNQICAMTIGLENRYCSNFTYVSNLELSGSFHSGGKIVVECSRTGSVQRAVISERSLL